MHIPDKALSPILPRANQIQALLSRTHQKISNSKKTDEIDLARQIMRAALDYFAAVLAAQGAIGLAHVNLDKFGYFFWFVDNKSYTHEKDTL